MYLEELFLKIPFPIGIWDIVNEKILMIRGNYDKTVVNSYLESCEIENLRQDIQNFIKIKGILKINTSKYIIQYEFLADNVFYEIFLPKGNIEFILSSISHKIRNPLTNILGLTSILKKNGDSNKGYINSIKESSGSIVNVANNIIDLLNIYQEKETKKEDEVEVCAIIKSVLKQFKAISIKKNINIIFKDKKPLLISTNKDKFTQLLVSIIDNSVKFTNSGAIQISIKEKTIKISDTGLGISNDKKKIIDKIIDINVDDHENNRLVQGLGLLLCKYICRDLNIIIKYKSTEGEGTTFYIGLPM